MERVHLGKHLRDILGVPNPEGIRGDKIPFLFKIE
jgi:hypothetical protein